MAAITRGNAQVHPLTVVLRASVVGLTLATAAIHASLGGMLFMANAAGYAILAIAMVIPGPVGKWRWLIRLALIGFTAATIGGWVAFGPRFGLAYLDKAIEVALIGVLLDRAVAVGRWSGRRLPTGSRPGGRRRCWDLREERQVSTLPADPGTLAARRCSASFLRPTQRTSDRVRGGWIDALR